jgi:hypothetical protein
MNRKQADRQLEEMARPLIEYLKQNCHPHTAIVVTDGRVAVVETVLSIVEESVN